MAGQISTTLMSYLQGIGLTPEQITSLIEATGGSDAALNEGEIRAAADRYIAARDRPPGPPVVDPGTGPGPVPPPPPPGTGGGPPGQPATNAADSHGQTITPEGVTFGPAGGNNWGIASPSPGQPPVGDYAPDGTFYGAPRGAPSGTITPSATNAMYAKLLERAMSLDPNTPNANVALGLGFPVPTGGTPQNGGHLGDPSNDMTVAQYIDQFRPFISPDGSVNVYAGKQALNETYTPARIANYVPPAPVGPSPTVRSPEAMAFLNQFAPNSGAAKTSVSSTGQAGNYGTWVAGENPLPQSLPVTGAVPPAVGSPVSSNVIPGTAAPTTAPAAAPNYAALIATNQGYVNNLTAAAKTGALSAQQQASLSAAQAHITDYSARMTVPPAIPKASV